MLRRRRRLELNRRRARVRSESIDVSMCLDDGGGGRAFDNSGTFGGHGNGRSLGATEQRLAGTIGELHLLNLGRGGGGVKTREPHGQVNVLAGGAVLVGQRRNAEGFGVSAQKFAFVEQQVAFVAQVVTHFGVELVGDALVEAIDCTQQ